MKILIASDIHGRLEKARLLEKRIHEENPDKIWFLGDLLYNGPRNGVPDDYDPMAVSQILKPFMPISLLISGNCDARVDAMLLGKEMLLNAKERAFDRDFWLFHGDEPSYKGLSLKQSDILLFGHTHLYEMGYNEKGYYLLNAGSVGFPKRGHESTYMVLENGQSILKRLDDGSAIMEKPLP